MRDGMTIAVFGVVCLFLIWMLYKRIKHDPSAFSKENMGKSVHTLGILGIFLALAIYFVIALLNS